VSDNKIIAAALPAELVSVMSCYGGGLEANKTMQVSLANTAAVSKTSGSNRSCIFLLFLRGFYVKQQQRSKPRSRRHQIAVLGASSVQRHQRSQS
jgi:hypothetical protein